MDKLKTLFFDIETLPAPQETHEILKEIHKKKLAKGSKYVSTFEQFIESTGLDGSYGRIACISFAFDDDMPQTLSGDEVQILKDFWEIAKKAKLFVGFNILDFDLKFIYQRSVILKVKPSVNLPIERCKSDPIFDVMWEWVRWNQFSRISLDTLSKVLGIPSSKDGSVTGKSVSKAFEEGRIKEICEYCERDIDVTRKIYKRMIFEE
jgi:3'-5' exonuclease